MKRIIKLTERDLTRIVKRVINEMDEYSPNVIKYGKSMRGSQDPFLDRRIPESKYDEGDIVTINRYGTEGKVLNVMFDHDNNQFVYQVRGKVPGGNRYIGEFTDEELS